MKSALTLWANLEAARDDSSMNLSFVTAYHYQYHIIYQPNLQEVIHIPIFPKLWEKNTLIRMWKCLSDSRSPSSVFSFSKIPQAREVKLQFAKYARFAPLIFKAFVIFNSALYALKYAYKNIVFVIEMYWTSATRKGTLTILNNHLSYTDLCDCKSKKGAVLEVSIHQVYYANLKVVTHDIWGMRFKNKHCYKKYKAVSMDVAISHRWNKSFLFTIIHRVT